VQAAQLGIAKSAFLPTLNDNVSVSGVSWTQVLNQGRDYYNLNNSLAASYLLYDFGSRDATLENARQLLLAVSATQSAVVQNILLSAIKAYYQVQTDMRCLKRIKSLNALIWKVFRRQKPNIRQVFLRQPINYRRRLPMRRRCSPESRLKVRLKRIMGYWPMSWGWMPMWRLS